MKNYDYWKDRKELNKNKIIFILSGMFYRTFDIDARVLSDNFGFKINKYESNYIGYRLSSYKI